MFVCQIRSNVLTFAQLLLYCISLRKHSNITLHLSTRLAQQTLNTVNINVCQSLDSCTVCSLKSILFYKPWPAHIISVWKVKTEHGFLLQRSVCTRLFYVIKYSGEEDYKKSLFCYENQEKVHVGVKFLFLTWHCLDVHIFYMTSLQSYRQFPFIT